MAIVSVFKSCDLSILSVFLTSGLYSSVGHGGASAYLAVLSILGANPVEAVSTALILNVLVAGLACISYARAGYLDIGFTSAFIVTSVPAAFIAGLLKVDTGIYEFVLGVVLIIAAVRLFMPTSINSPVQSRPLIAMLVAGAVIGFLSGLVGIGGGVLLSPLILLRRWADTKTASATAALFIVANSIAALAGRALHNGVVLTQFGPLLFAALFGGFAGSQLGARFIPTRQLQVLLAFVLLIAAVKELL
ncbi:MAG: sulfite exporter TauE/SafE family protein [Candidatus Obscuribacterales bacterium]|nr:sulfite exporter TauE/SafE family protein [Candidatus Obscuribacterales bacterium]